MRKVQIGQLVLEGKEKWAFPVGETSPEGYIVGSDASIGPIMKYQGGAVYPIFCVFIASHGTPAPDTQRALEALRGEFRRRKMELRDTVAIGQDVYEVWGLIDARADRDSINAAHAAAQEVLTEHPWSIPRCRSYYLPE